MSTDNIAILIMTKWWLAVDHHSLFSGVANDKEEEKKRKGSNSGIKNASARSRKERTSLCTV